MATKIKKVKAKTHRATAKRLRVSGGGKVIHRGQGAGNGHSMSFKNRRQRKAPRKLRALNSAREIRRIKVLING